MHPASYSLISPYVMSALGVRATMVVVGTVSAVPVMVIIRAAAGSQAPSLVGGYAALALVGNAVSGRVDLRAGAGFLVGSLAVVFAWPRPPRHRLEQWGRGLLAALLAGLATAASPVAGLFLGLVAAPRLAGRRRASLVVGVLPVAVVLGTAGVLPVLRHRAAHFGGAPAWWPLVLATAGWALIPRGWRVVRFCSAVYAAAVLLVWHVVPTPIGVNVTRLALLFGGVRR